MKRSISSVFRLIFCGILTIGLAICAPVVGTSSPGLVSAAEESDCINNLTIRITSNPANISYGQSSVLNWSVGLPSECGYASVQLNSKPVALSGTQLVTPTQSTTYHVTVFFNLNRISGEKTVSTHVTVNDASVNLFCPDLPQPHFVEIWETAPKMDTKQETPLDQPLTKVLEVPKTTILLGPVVILNFGGVSDDDIPLTIDPGVILMSACAFLPDGSEPQRDDLITNESDPAAESTTSI